MIWALAALSVVCIGQCLLLFAGYRSAAAERRRLLNAVICKTPQEFAMMEKITTSRAKPKMQPDKPQVYGL